MRAELFYTADFLNPINLVICGVQRGQYAHVGVMFTMSPEEWDALCDAISFPAALRPEIMEWPGGLYRVYFESIAKKDQRTQKNGVRGPYDFRRVTEWQQSKPKTRRLDIQLIDCSEAESILAFNRLWCAVPIIKYASWQIVQNAMGLWFHRGVAPKGISEHRWTCVETPARVFRRHAVDNWKLGDVRYDEYVVSGKRGAGLWELNQPWRQYRRALLDSTRPPDDPPFPLPPCPLPA